VRVTRRLGNALYWIACGLAAAVFILIGVVRPDAIFFKPEGDLTGKAVFVVIVTWTRAIN
jgi:hypothetical protein